MCVPAPQAHVQHCIVGSNALALRAAGERARELGFTPIVLTSRLCGEAAAVAAALASVAAEQARGGPFGLGPLPLALLAGGETTVTICGPHGVGGRNQVTPTATTGAPM